MKNAMFSYPIFALGLFFAGCDMNDYGGIIPAFKQWGAMDGATVFSGVSRFGTGSVVFWAMPDSVDGEIYVTVTNVETGRQFCNAIRSGWGGAEAPDCDQCPQCAHFQLPEGTYGYYIQREDAPDISHGSVFEVTTGGCNAVHLTRK